MIANRQINEVYVRRCKTDVSVAYATYLSASNAVITSWLQIMGTTYKFMQKKKISRWGPSGLQPSRGYTVPPLQYSNTTPSPVLRRGCWSDPGTLCSWQCHGTPVENHNGAKSWILASKLLYSLGLLNRGVLELFYRSAVLSLLPLLQWQCSYIHSSWSAASMGRGSQRSFPCGPPAKISNSAQPGFEPASSGLHDSPHTPCGTGGVIFFLSL